MNSMRNNQDQDHSISTNKSNESIEDEVQFSAVVRAQKPRCPIKTYSKSHRPRFYPPNHHEKTNFKSSNENNLNLDNKEMKFNFLFAGPNESETEFLESNSNSRADNVVFVPSQSSNVSSDEDKRLDFSLAETGKPFLESNSNNCADNGVFVPSQSSNVSSDEDKHLNFSFPETRKPFLESNSNSCADNVVFVPSQSSNVSSDEDRSLNFSFSETHKPDSSVQNVSCPEVKPVCVKNGVCHLPSKLKQFNETPQSSNLKSKFYDQESFLKKLEEKNKKLLNDLNINDSAKIKSKYNPNSDFKENGCQKFSCPDNSDTSHVVKPLENSETVVKPMKRISLQEYWASKKSGKQKDTNTVPSQLLKPSNDQSTKKICDDKLTSSALLPHVARKIGELDENLKKDTNISLNKSLFYGQGHKQTKSSEEEVLIVSDEEDEPLTKAPSMPTVFVPSSSQETISGGGSELLEEEDEDVEFVNLRCSMVLVGSYAVTPTTSVRVSPGCLTLVVPTLIEGDPPTKLILKTRGIMKVHAHFGDEFSVLFLYLRPSTAAYVRRLVKMSRGHGGMPYFDPVSSDDSEKRIVLLPTAMKLYERRIVVQLLNDNSDHSLVECIDHDHAQNILHSCYPQNKVSPVKIAGSDSISLFVYPPETKSGGITVTTDDYKCLAEGQFLNDVIIDFYLRWLMLNKVSESDRNRTHVFSTFFYKRLTTKPKKGFPSNEDNPNLTAAQKRHSRVKTWTKNVDLFSKDFVLIPINVQSHWLLAIICFPGNVRDTGEKGAVPSKVVGGSTGDSSDILNDAFMRNSMCSDSDRDEAEGDDEELCSIASEDFHCSWGETAVDSGEVPIRRSREEGEESRWEEPPCKRGKLVDSEDWNSQSEVIKQPCIFLFDSLRMPAYRSPIVRTLREYLSEEYSTRKGGSAGFSRDTMPGAPLKVPQQDNFTDCGLFTLQYAENFFRRPLKKFSVPYPSLKFWFDKEIVDRKREAIATLILKLTNEINPSKSSSIPLISFNARKGSSGPDDASFPSPSSSRGNNFSDCDNNFTLEIKSDTSVDSGKSSTVDVVNDRGSGSLDEVYDRFAMENDSEREESSGSMFGTSIGAVKNVCSGLFSQFRNLSDSVLGKRQEPTDDFQSSVCEESVHVPRNRGLKTDISQGSKPHISSADRFANKRRKSSSDSPEIVSLCSTPYPKSPTSLKSDLSPIFKAKHTYSRNKGHKTPRPFPSLSTHTQIPRKVSSVSSGTISISDDDS